MRLSYLEIKNYKSVDYLRIHIDSLTAIVGKNNFGKSTILDAIQCFYGEKAIESDNFHLGTDEDIEVTIIFDEISDYDIERCFGYKTMVAKTNLKIKERIEDGEFAKKQLEKLKSDRDKKFIEVNEKYNIDYPNKCTITVTFSYSKKGKGTYKINENTNIAKSDLLKFLPPIKVISAIRTPDKETTAGTKSNLKELISLLQSENDSEDYIEMPKIDGKLSYGEIKTLISKKEEEKCKYLSEDLTKNFQNAINTDSLLVKVKIDNSFKFDFKYKTVLEDKDVPGREIDILSCGTGLQSMMILSILQSYIKLKKDDDFILLIEEPEVYLHPSLQRKMISTLLKISEKNQIILTTHSPIIISKIDKGNIHCVNKDKGVTFMVEASVENIVQELGVQISDILNKQAVIFVEGKDDSRLFSLLINKIAKQKGLETNFAEKYIDMIQTDGFDKMSFYANAQILHKDAVKTPYWVITDSDGEYIEDRKKDLMEKGKANGLNIREEQFKILSEYAIESYFLAPILLEHVFGFNEKESTLLHDTYFQKYEEALYSLRQGKGIINKKTFRNNYKPKIMFSNLDKPEEIIELILNKYYYTDVEFKRLRKKLIEEWNNQSDPIGYFIDQLDYSVLVNSKMNEVICHLDEIIGSIVGK
ncbi:AAA family ATPase [Cytobacillus sp. FSL M8-0252]|uniref:AAA family ATPase n=1 Tax=Cytobacillus sp. FSL M8-0252 TaxID=2921621 RepID=UPI0030F76BA9